AHLSRRSRRSTAARRAGCTSSPDPRVSHRVPSGVTRGMKTSTEDGVLVLADISGFTAFVASTALEHGPVIVASLLEAVMEQLSPPLDIQEVEGDAVFAVGPDRTVPRAKLLAVLDDAFTAFRSKQRKMEA